MILFLKLSNTILDCISLSLIPKIFKIFYVHKSFGEYTIGIPKFQLYNVSLMMLEVNESNSWKT